jgi:3-oxoadipate enol-lactonase
VLRRSRRALRLFLLFCSFLIAGTNPRSLSAQPAQSPPQQAQSGFADISGGHIYYESAGGGHPLVLIHGGQMDRRMWDQQFQLFSKTYRVIRYDVRGFGKSPASTNVYADEEDLAALLKFLHVEKAYVVGLSLGGRIAIDFALTHFGMVDAIVPVAPGA